VFVTSIDVASVDSIDRRRYGPEGDDVTVQLDRWRSRRRGSYSLRPAAVDDSRKDNARVRFHSLDDREVRAEPTNSLGLADGGAGDGRLERVEGRDGYNRPRVSIGVTIVRTAPVVMMESGEHGIASTDSVSDTGSLLVRGLGAAVPRVERRTR